MRNMALTWQQAAELAAVLYLLSTVLFFGVRVCSAGSSLLARTRPFITEIATISALYAVWQFLGTAPVFAAAGAQARGESIQRWEKWLHLPSEHLAQRPLLDHPLLAKSADLYYDTMHFTLMFVLLVWVFVRHRSRYRDLRTLLILVTLACFVVQLLPVAPPRLLPDAGYVDTAARYGQSVYSAFGALDPNQLSAMPSMHVAWATLVALTVVTVSTSRWRWLAIVHPMLTTYVVAATANHYWADGIVAIALLGFSVVVMRASKHALAPLLARVLTRIPHAVRAAGTATQL